MKKIFLQLGFFIIISIVVLSAYSQCNNSSSFGSATAPTDDTPFTISTNQWETEYNTISNVVAGETYQSASSCGSYITVRSGTPGGTVIAHGWSPLTWTATVSGTYYIHYNTDAACGTATNSCITTITCTSCGGGGGAMLVPSSGNNSFTTCGGNLYDFGGPSGIMFRFPEQ